MTYAIVIAALLCSRLVAAQPESQDEQRKQLALLETLKWLVERDDNDRSREAILATWTPRPVRVSGTLVKTPDQDSRSPRTGLPQRYHWHLAARLDSGQLNLPLQIADEKLLRLADDYAGKEVVLTGSTVIARRLVQRYEPVPFLAVQAKSLQPAKK